MPTGKRIITTIDLTENADQYDLTDSLNEHLGGLELLGIVADWSYATPDGATLAAARED